MATLERQGPALLTLEEPGRHGPAAPALVEQQAVQSQWARLPAPGKLLGRQARQAQQALAGVE